MPARHRTDLTRGQPLPSTFVNAQQDLLSVLASNFRIELASPTTVRVPAAATNNGNDTAAVSIEGKWRFNQADVSAAHPGGAAGVYDVFVTANPNDLSLADPADATNYAFGLVIRPRVGGAPDRPPAAGATTHSRRVGIVFWNGSAITQLIRLAPTLSSTEVRATATTEQAVNGPGASATVLTADFVVPYDGVAFLMQAQCNVFVNTNPATGYGVRLQLFVDGVQVWGDPNSRAAFPVAVYDVPMSAQQLLTGLTAGVHTASLKLVNDLTGTQISVARTDRTLMLTMVP